jgi:hypothetical protein
METPIPFVLDFDALARRIVDLTDPNLVRDQLRIVWNERGAVDIGTAESALIEMMGPDTAGIYIKKLDRALRSLDARPDDE